MAFSIGSLLWPDLECSPLCSCFPSRSSGIRYFSKTFFCAFTIAKKRFFRKIFFSVSWINFFYDKKKNELRGGILYRFLIVDGFGVPPFCACLLLFSQNARMLTTMLLCAFAFPSFSQNVWMLTTMLLFAFVLLIFAFLHTYIFAQCFAEYWNVHHYAPVWLRLPPFASVLAGAARRSWENSFPLKCVQKKQNQIKS